MRRILTWENAHTFSKYVLMASILIATARISYSKGRLDERRQWLDGLETLMEEVYCEVDQPRTVDLFYRIR